MSNFIEIHIRPKNEAIIIQKTVIEALWPAPHGGCNIGYLVAHGARTVNIEVSDSYEELRAALLELKEGKV